MGTIDLRSDTVTKPTPEMREAMAEAEVGDDVYGDDPTVNRLEALAADMLGKEASIFVPSGTMGNLLALLIHCQRGDEAIVGERSHIYLNEAGGMSALGGIHPRPLRNQKEGTLALEEIRSAIRAEDVHQPITRLICIENTQNNCGGMALSIEYTRQVGEIARANNLRFHIDGARIFNAAAVLGVDVKDLASPADSVMFCLSKGLASPVGSMLTGAKTFIARARHLRKMLGGGMRQAGILAAAGIVSLEKMSKRVGEDHIRAKKLADGLRNIPGILLDEGTPFTNMVYFNIADNVSFDEKQLCETMSNYEILIDWAGARRIRLVTHYAIDDAGIDKTIQAFTKVFRYESVS
ncbi:MAG TPA: low-specificity L-threonine aldolase [Anaerolineales bacterium]|nr:low-specificity L-threonine aldolase [Anaerolineales bacterium]HNS61094.1 low-specificity L-threonine aldolase [Anaerolineales bacterium]